MSGPRSSNRPGLRKTGSQEALGGEVNYPVVKFVCMILRKKRERRNAQGKES